MKFADKVAVVTGGARGIGAAIALKLAVQGASIAIVDKDDAEQSYETIAAVGGTAAKFVADVADQGAVHRTIAAIVQRFGRIDILINNAGIFEERRFSDIDANHVSRLFNTNMMGMLHMTQAATPYFPAIGGRIVNVSTNMIYAPRPGTAIYAASKAAVSVMTRVLAQELGARGITVNAVAPSWTDTDMTRLAPQAQRQAVLAHTPAGRIGEPADIADVLAFLASDDSRWITGRTLLADGGMTDGL
jgi:3-oxoacyl-[acyl-carrier protein] reductase